MTYQLLSMLSGRQIGLVADRHDHPLWTALLLALTFLSLVGAAPAVAEGRWALVLGISTYDDPNIPTIVNTVNDARTMAGALNQMDFDVYYLENASRATIESSIQQIAAEHSDADLGLLYFAGHGVQVNGVNYALPSDIRTDSDDFLAKHAISVNAVIQQFKEMDTKNLVVILDSCRDSPFPDQTAIGTGLALVDAPDNTIIAYSTAPGEVALDGSGANSPYTAALASALDGPEQDIRDVLRLVRAQVRLATRGSQTPWFVDNSSEPILIQPHHSGEDSPDMEVLAYDQISLAASAWWTIENSADPRDFETFVKQFPETDLADAARRQLARFDDTGKPSFPLMDLGLPDLNPEVPDGLTKLITECDVLATGLHGQLNLAEPVPHDLINTRVAMRACLAATKNDPDNARLLALLGRLMSLEERYPESLFYGRRSAALGNADAWGGIAAAYRFGHAVPKDLERAADALRTGALAGSTAARFDMGIYYREGWGVPPSNNEARRWMELAVLEGHSGAMTALGDMYRRGLLGPKNPAKAIEYYRKAAALGKTDAMNNIGMGYMRGDGVPKDTDRGITWLSQASEHGNPYAAYHLGKAFMTGWGVEENRDQAIAFFRLSAQRSFLTAYIALGDALQSDEDTSLSLPQALANYIIARDAGELKGTKKAREESAEAQQRIEALIVRMSPEEKAEGERIAEDWIDQYGLLDFYRVFQ